MTREVVSPMSAQDRADLHFARKVRAAFIFLEELGFVRVEELPTLVRYRNEDIEVDVYHGRRSFEVGSGVAGLGVRYAMSELIRVADPEAAKTYRLTIATTPAEVADALEELSSLMRRYGAAALRGESQSFSALAKQREQWSEDYALDVLAGQLRPQADDAFRRGDYATAAQLYERIRGRLSLAEVKKLALAQSRSKR
jgi:hypothetical protein